MSVFEMAHADVFKVFNSTPTTLKLLVRGLSDDQLRHKGPEDDHWSALEVICHLCDTEQRMLTMAKKFSANEAAAFSAWNPDQTAVDGKYLEQDPTEALKTFETRRAETVKVLEGLNRDQWKKTAEHPRFGTISVLEYATHMATHDADHMGQISRRINDVIS